MAIHSVNKTRITDAIYQQFMQAIAVGEWSQGAKIPPETKLAAKMGVSRLSVRSALSKLSALGLVESRQGEGTFVCEFSGAQYINNLIPFMMLSKPSIFNLLEFRKIFDSESAKLAAMRATDEDIIALKDNLICHKAAGTNMALAPALDMEFHSLIAKATRNPLLDQIYNVMKDIFVYALMDIIPMMGVDNAYEYHEALIAAISEHNPDKAKQIMEEHLDKNLQAAFDHKIAEETVIQASKIKNWDLWNNKTGKSPTKNDKKP